MVPPQIDQVQGEDDLRSYLLFAGFLDSNITPKNVEKQRYLVPDIDKSLDLEKFSKRNDSDFSLSLARS